MGNLAQYEHGLDADALDETDREVQSAYANEFAKLEQGENVFRFLPAKERGQNPLRIIHEHYLDIEVAGKKKTVKFVCSRMMSKGKERCPACDMADKLMKGNSVDKQAARDFKPGMRIYANVIDRNREEEGPRVFAFGKSIFDQLKKIRQSKRAGGDFVLPTEKGFDIIIEREGEGLSTKYKVFADRDRAVLSDDEDLAVEWIENQWPLENYAVLNEYKHNLALMNGDDPKEAARRSSRKALSAGDEEEDGGRRSRRSRRSAADDLEEDGGVIDAEYRESGGDDGDDDDDVPY